MITTFMSLDLPTPSVTLGPEWAADLNAALELVDAHDHTSNKGKQITPAAININDDFELNNNPLQNATYLNLESQSGTLPDADIVYNVNGDLYWNNGAAVPVQITAGGSVVSTPSSLTIIDYTTVNVDISISPASDVVFYAVDTTAPRTITIPQAASVAAGRFYVIKDADGLSETNTLTVAASGADTIDGVASVPLQSNYGSWTLVSDGVDKYFIF